MLFRIERTDSPLHTCPSIGKLHHRRAETLMYVFRSSKWRSRFPTNRTFKIKNGEERPGNVRSVTVKSKVTNRGFK